MTDRHQGKGGEGVGLLESVGKPLGVSRSIYRDELGCSSASSDLETTWILQAKNKPEISQTPEMHLRLDGLHGGI